MNYTEKSTYTHNGEVIEFHYSPTATYTEQVSFVDIVSKNVFVDGNYLLLLEDITFNFMLVKTFTDIKSDCIAEGDIDAFAEFDKATDITNKLRKLINPQLIKTLETSVKDNIVYKKNIAHDNISTALVALINTVKEKIEAFGDGLDSNAVMEFIQKFNETDLNSESLVNAYFNSDNYKNNVAELVDSKNAQIRELKQKVNDITAQNVLSDKYISDDKVVPIKQGK